MRAYRVWCLVLYCLAIAFGVAGCTGGGGEKSAGPVTKGVVVLYPTEGSAVEGNVMFAKSGKGIRVVAKIQGLTPGLHGFHIHEYGDCTSPDANSAGGHFNPGSAPHGAPTSDKHHIGDLGNIEADSSGVARLETVIERLTLEGPESILGRAVIVHASPDDFTTQPTGGAGARLACGVIGATK